MILYYWRETGKFMVNYIIMHEIEVSVSVVVFWVGHLLPLS